MSLPPYEPSPEEIAAGCAKIQEEWSEFERTARAAWLNNSWQPPGTDRFMEKLDRKRRGNDIKAD